SLIATHASPVLDIKHFCDAVTQTSTPHSSKANGMPASVETASTIVMAPCAAATRATAATSFATPVDVSPYATATARTFGCAASSASSSSAFALWSQLVDQRWTTSPYDAAIFAHISPN